MAFAFPPRPDCPVPSTPAIEGSLVVSCDIQAAPPPIFVFPIFEFPLPNPPGFTFGCYRPSVFVNFKRLSQSDVSSFFSSSSGDFFGVFQVEVQYPNSSETGNCEPTFKFFVRFPSAVCPDLSAEAKIQVQTKSLYARASAEQDPESDCKFVFKFDVGIPCIQFLPAESSVEEGKLSILTTTGEPGQALFQFCSEDSSDNCYAVTVENFFQFNILFSSLSSSSSQQACQFIPVMNFKVPLRPLVYAVEGAWPCFGYLPIMPSDAGPNAPSSNQYLPVPCITGESCGVNVVVPHGDEVWDAATKGCFIPVISALRLRTAYVAPGESMTLRAPTGVADPSNDREEFVGPGTVIALDYRRVWLPIYANDMKVEVAEPSSTGSVVEIAIGEEFEMPVGIGIEEITSSACKLTAGQQESTCPGGLEEVDFSVQRLFKIRLMTQPWKITGSITSSLTTVTTEFNENWLGVDPACCKPASFISFINFHHVNNKVILDITYEDVLMPKVGHAANPIAGETVLAPEGTFTVVSDLRVKTDLAPGCPGCEYTVQFDLKTFKLPPAAGFVTDEDHTIDVANVPCCTSIEFVEKITGFTLVPDPPNADKLTLAWTTRHFSIPKIRAIPPEEWPAPEDITINCGDGQWKFQAGISVVIEDDEDCPPCGRKLRLRMAEYKLLLPEPGFSTPIINNTSPECCTAFNIVEPPVELVLNNCQYYIQYGRRTIYLPKIRVTHPNEGNDPVEVPCVSNGSNLGWNFDALKSLPDVQPDGGDTPCCKILIEDKVEYRINLPGIMNSFGKTYGEIPCCTDVNTAAQIVNSKTLELGYDLENCRLTLKWEYFELKLPKLELDDSGPFPSEDVTCQNGEFTFVAVKDIELLNNPECPPCGQILRVNKAFYFMGTPSAGTSSNEGPFVDCCESIYVVDADTLRLTKNGRDDDDPIPCGYNLKFTKRKLTIPKDDWSVEDDPTCDPGMIQYVSNISVAPNMGCPSSCANFIYVSKDCLRPAEGATCDAEVICGVSSDGGGIIVKTRTFSFVNGLLADCGTCGGWTPI